MKKIAILILGILVLTSCDQKTKGTSKNLADENLTIDSNKFEDEDINYPGKRKMDEINSIVGNLEEVHSLRWEKRSEGLTSFTEVVAYLNDDGVPQKIIEYYSNGNYQDQGERHYYLENQKLVAFENRKDSWLDSNTFIYEEIQTFYNNNEPVMTRKRSASTIDDIEGAAWKNIRPESHTLTRVNKILSGTGEFETHFISIIEAQAGLFLLLGENKESDRYLTTVRVDEKTPFIEDLLSNLEEYKYRPIEVNFVIEGGGGQPQFQVLTDARWKDEE